MSAADVVSEARAMLESVTPGEWGIEWHETSIAGIKSDSEDSPDCACNDCAKHPRNYSGQILETDLHYYAPTLQDAQFIAASPRLVRGLLAEVDRLRDGGSMASAPRKDAAPTAAEPAVLHASIDPPAVTLHGLTVAEWQRFAERVSAAGIRLSQNTLGLADGAAENPEPRCLCTHRWAEHYGTGSNLYPARGCQRAGCECLGFEEP